MKWVVYTSISCAVIVLSATGAYLWAEAYHESQIETTYQSVPARIVAHMTLEQKVGQLIHIGMQGKSANARVRENIEGYHVGGIIHFGHNFESRSQIVQLNSDLQNAANAASRVPLLISTDQEGGRVVRVGAYAADQYPGAMAIGQAADPQIAYDVGFMTAHQLRSIGINFLLAPVLDVNNNPANPVINTRAFGSDATLVSEMGVSYMQGARAGLGIPVVKHFPGHGDTNVDSHLDLPRIEKDLAALRGTELVPFREAVSEGADAVMTAHILFASLDSESPATLSPRILKGLLREELGFRGLVVSDAMEMHAISERYSYGDAAVLAFKAGVDVILLTGEGEPLKEIYTALYDGFRDRRLDEVELNRAVERQIRLKFEYGILHQHEAPALLDSIPEPFRNEIAARVNRRKIESSQILSEIEARYADGPTLNERASRASIVSLRKDSHGVKIHELDSVVVLARSPTIRNEAMNFGVARRSVHAMRSHNDILRMARQRRAGQIWIVELQTTSDLRVWNRVVERINDNATLRGQGRIYGLYTGNPFLNIAIPGNGAVLTSFSTTRESYRALAYRSLRDEPIRKANLILTETGS